MVALIEAGWLAPVRAALLVGVSPQTVRHYGDRGLIRVRVTDLGRLYAEDDCRRLAAERAQRHDDNGPEAA